MLLSAARCRLQRTRGRYVEVDCSRDWRRDSDIPHIPGVSGILRGVLYVSVLRTLDSPTERKAGMTTLHPHVLHINQDKGVVVDEAGRTMEEFVVLTDEHGGVHVLPRHLYEEIQQATHELTNAVEDRRAHLQNVLAKMPERKNEGDLSNLRGEVRAFAWARQQLNRRF
jgi:hypothetical protein